MQSQENWLYFGKTILGVEPMPTVTIRRSGNASIISLPKTLLEQMNAGVGDNLEISYQDGKIILQRPKKRKTLEEMLIGVTPEMFQTEEDLEWMEMKPVGKEIW